MDTSVEELFDGDDDEACKECGEQPDDCWCDKDGGEA